MEGFLSKKIKTVKSRSVMTIGVMVFCTLFFIAIGVLMLIFAVGTATEDPESASTGYWISAGGFAVGALCMFMCIKLIKGRVAASKNPYILVNVYGTNDSAADVVRRFDQQCETKKYTEIRSPLEPAEVYMTDTYLAEIHNGISVIDLTSVIWVSYNESLLNNNKSGIYGFYFYAKRAGGGKTPPMLVTLTDGNLAGQLKESLKSYPFKVGADKNLERLFRNKEYDRFEAECLAQMKK